MAGQIAQRAPAVFRQCESGAERGELVGPVERAGARGAAVEFARGHRDYLGGMTVPQRLHVRAAALE